MVCHFAESRCDRETYRRLSSRKLRFLTLNLYPLQVLSLSSKCFFRVLTGFAIISTNLKLLNRRKKATTLEKSSIAVPKDDDGSHAPETSLEIHESTATEVYVNEELVPGENSHSGDTTTEESDNDSGDDSNKEEEKAKKPTEDEDSHAVET